MWNDVPLDILAKIFSFLSPDSLACANTTCRHWRRCGRGYQLSSGPPVAGRHPPWFVGVPMRNRGGCCFVRNPVTARWHVLPLDFLPDPVRLISSLGGLLLLRPTSTTIHQLAVCNLFTRQYKLLPKLNTLRTNPATGIVPLDPTGAASSFHSFSVYVAGGMSDAPCGGSMYECTLEIYDSVHRRWRIIGSLPAEFAVRLTVWTPNESVYSGGVLYWMTSARAYSIMGFEIETNEWHELSIPLADQLEFAALIRRKGRLALLGGTSGGAALAWELIEGGAWGLIEEMPLELGKRLLGEKANWGNTKCVGIDGVVCLYRDLGSGMLVWREKNEDKGTWEWLWVEGCCSVGGAKVQNIPIKGVLLHPNLSPSHFLK